MIKAAVLGLLCFLAFLAVHVIVFRAIELKERFKAMTWIFYALVPVYAAAYFIVPSHYVIIDGAFGVPPDIEASVTRALYFLSGFMLYVFLFLGYCQFYFIVDRSISVRVMIEIEKSPKKRLSYDEIQSVYSFYEIFSRRLGHMLENKYVTCESGFYANTTKGRIEALVFNFLKEFLRLGKGG